MNNKQRKALRSILDARLKIIEDDIGYVPIDDSILENFTPMINLSIALSLDSISKSLKKLTKEKQV